MDVDYIVVPSLIVLIAILITWFSIRRILSLPKKSYAVWRKFTERCVLSLVVLVTLALAVSSGFNAIALYYFRHPPPGQMYVVNGSKMRIDCMGSGSPTIILDAGGGNDGLIWTGVEPVLAKTTRVCSYDRAGMGWSDTVSTPRDADHIATELHGLLAASKINGQVVLMGHSIAGMYIRDYATRYPAEVSGLIFVDGSSPLQDQNPALKRHDEMRQTRWYDPLVNEVAFDTGIPRLLGACVYSAPEFDAKAAKLFAEDRCHESFRVGESENFRRSGEETLHTGPYGDLPILIFSQDPAKNAAGVLPPDMGWAWTLMQENLKKLSTRSRRIIAKDSEHYIQLNRPELIEREVPLFIEQIRNNTPPSSPYGSTTTE
jgi:pimeloyl-ACP methyl ester carboxylesterase